MKKPSLKERYFCFSDVWDEEVVIIVNDMKRILLNYFFICAIEMKTCGRTMRLNWNKIEYVIVRNYLYLSWKGILESADKK